MLIGGVGALHVGDGIVRAEASEGVDVAVGVVTGEVAVVKPQDTIGMEVMQQTLLDLLAVEVGVTVGGQQTLAGGQENAASVALDAATFQNEIEMRFV